EDGFGVILAGRTKRWVPLMSVFANDERDRPDRQRFLARLGFGSALDLLFERIALCVDVALRLGCRLCFRPTGRLAGQFRLSVVLGRYLRGYCARSPRDRLLLSSDSLDGPSRVRARTRSSDPFPALYLCVPSLVSPLLIDECPFRLGGAAGQHNSTEH